LDPEYSLITAEQKNPAMNLKVMKPQALGTKAVAMTNNILANKLIK
jgi:hypothetical protein